MDGKNLKFKAFLVKNGIKQKDVAELLGITEANLSEKVNGKQYFTYPQMELLCRTYGLSADIFLPHDLPNGKI